MRRIFPTVRLLAAAVLIFFSTSCSEGVPGFIVPPPDDNKDNTQTENPKSDDGKDDLTEESVANLCDEEFLGQKPMIIAYYTENSSALPDPSCLTHINYAHGRFVDKETGDGGIWIEKPELLEKVIALKQQKPSLKVLLMIGGWGDKADGFSMMARDARKRTLFCQSCKEHIDNYGLDGIDIDWEYPTAGPSENGRHPDDTRNFNLVLKGIDSLVGIYMYICGDRIIPGHRFAEKPKASYKLNSNEKDTYSNCGCSSDLRLYRTCRS